MDSLEKTPLQLRWETLYMEESGLVRKALRSILLKVDESLIEDLLHDVMAKLARIEDFSTSKAYVWRTARNTAISYARAEACHRRLEERYFLENLGAELPIYLEDYPGAQAVLATLQASLPQEDRLLLQAKLAGLPHKQIATQLGVADGTVATRWWRLLDKLRAYVQKMNLSLD